MFDLALNAPSLEIKEWQAAANLIVLDHILNIYENIRIVNQPWF